jgi:hypothetical protein
VVIAKTLNFLGEMMKRLLFALVVCGLGAGAIAHADTITGSFVNGLTCSVASPCGTITVTDNSGGGVTVDETVAPNFFVVTGNGTNHVSLAMDLDTLPTGITITSFTPAGLSWSEGDNANPAGFNSGTYNYFVTLENCNGSSCPTVSELTFTLTGVTTADFLLTDAFPFVSDLNVAGATGNVGATATIGRTPPSATPEPSSLMLLGTGALGLAGVVRRRFGR